MCFSSLLHLFFLSQQNSIVSTIWMFALILIIFYFFIIRPQIKKQKIEKKFQENLKIGNYIVTNSGIHGKIVKIINVFFIIETISGKIKLEKNTISRDLTQLRYNSENENTINCKNDKKEKK
ncbi:preprotein translocase subunit YajC [Blattabacterium cuenoti]|uniref:preprotein translocase subunit YajC n=1 Tax=Blattabacterium cuenoti TaxID=1653831 RepID=UPI00163BC9A4|nr:preprotein translocase subunit YajC [Blattabacterium cuenoti]